MQEQNNLEKHIEKQMGCMSGFLQIFDRHQILTGKRLCSAKRLPPATVNFLFLFPLFLYSLFGNWENGRKIDLYAHFSGGGINTRVGEEHGFGFSVGIERIGEATTSEIGTITGKTEAAESATRAPISGAGISNSFRDTSTSDEVAASFPGFRTKGRHEVIVEVLQRSSEALFG